VLFYAKGNDELAARASPELSLRASDEV